jgi:hypothetical protein
MYDIRVAYILSAGSKTGILELLGGKSHIKP